MLNSIRWFPEYFKHYYDISDVYNQPVGVDLEQNDSYTFTTHHPEEKNVIDNLLQLTKTRKNGQLVTLNSLLKSPCYSDEDGEILENMGFRQLNSDPISGLTLEHDLFPGWLIKKNYGSMIDDDGIKKTITKAVGAPLIPRWMLPLHLRKIPNDKLVGFQVPNDGINPLRVAMLKRGRRWIKNLNLTHLKAAKEYLHFLPSAQHATQEPLHARVVVISKKEQILDESSNMMKFVQLANENPEKLKKIAAQICLFITCTGLTDLLLHNTRFLDDDTDTIFFPDGEPIGTIAETADFNTILAISKYDRAFFPVLGLRKLQASISLQMSDDGIPDSDIQRVQSIFDNAIDKRVQLIIWERTPYRIKKLVFDHLPGIKLLISIFNTWRVFILLLHTNLLHLTHSLQLTN